MVLKDEDEEDDDDKKKESYLWLLEALVHIYIMYVWKLCSIHSKITTTQYLFFLYFIEEHIRLVITTH